MLVDIKIRKNYYHMASITTTKTQHYRDLEWSRLTPSGHENKEPRNEPRQTKATKVEGVTRNGFNSRLDSITT